MENKQRILEKATQLFMRYGIRSITMDEIAAQLGISKKTIYQFFTDKDAMVEAVVDEEMKQNYGNSFRDQSFHRDFRRFHRKSDIQRMTFECFKHGLRRMFD